MTADIFISYSRQDSDKAEQLAELLTSAGLSCWIDREGIDLATSWSSEIVRAINDCKAFLVLLSPHSIVSPNVIKEVSLASEKRKKILPLDLEPVALTEDLEYQLAGLQRAPMTNIDAIIRALAKLGLQATSAPSYQIVKNPPPAPPARGRGEEELSPSRLRRGEEELSPSRLREGLGEGKTDTRKSLMILPFEDLSPTADNGWFADGIVSELIATLSHIKSLRVTDQQTTKEYKQYKGQLTIYAREMSIRYFVQGSVRKFGDQIKISMSLLDIETGDHLWQDSLKGTMQDIFEIQEEAAKKVVEGLKLHLTKEEEKKIEARGTENAEAYELLLKSKEYFDHATKEGFEYAIRLCEEALKRDPDFASASASLAIYLTQLFRSYDRNPDYLDRAEKVALRARELLPTMIDGYQALSIVYGLQQKKEQAEEMAKQSVVLEPQNSTCYNALGFFYFSTKQYEKAIPQFEQAIGLEPRSLIDHWNIVINCNRAGLAELRASWAVKALPLYEKHLLLFPDDETMLVHHTVLLGHANKTSEARVAIRTLETTKDPASMYRLATLRAQLGDYDEAMNMLSCAVKGGFADIETILTSPEFAPLREREDYRELMAGLSEP